MYRSGANEMKWNERIFIQAFKLQMSTFIMSWNIAKQIKFENIKIKTGPNNYYNNNKLCTCFVMFSEAAYLLSRLLV